MNRIKILLFLLLPLLFISGCTRNTKTVVYADGPNIKIYVTSPNLYVITADIINTRRKISLEQISELKTDGNELSGDFNAQKYADAQLCIINGMGYDDKIGEELKAINPKIEILDASKGIMPLENDSDMQGKSPLYTFLSPICTAIQYRNIASKIVEMDHFPKNSKEAEEDAKKVAKENAQKNIQKVMTATEEIHSRVLYTDKQLFTALNKAMGNSTLRLKNMTIKENKVTKKAMTLKECIEATKATSFPTELSDKYIGDGKLIPVATEECWFDYLIRDFCLKIDTRISSQNREEELQKLSNRKDLIVLLTSVSPGVDAELQARYPSLKLCFLQRTLPEKEYPSSINEIVLANFKSMEQSFKADKD